MIEDKVTEKMKKRLQDMGLIVNNCADKDKSSKSSDRGTFKKDGKN